MLLFSKSSLTVLMAPLMLVLLLDNGIKAQQNNLRRRNLLQFLGRNPTVLLGHCQGDCDADENCGPGLVCFRRDGTEKVPGCFGRFAYSGSDFCIREQDEPGYQSPSEAIPLNYLGKNPAIASSGGLQKCQGDCDEDANCAPGLTCFRRNGNEPVPGCTGNFNVQPGADYCIGSPESTIRSTTNSNMPWIVSNSSMWAASGDFDLARPNNMVVGDLLLLFISRSDGALPIRKNNWTPVASCYKNENQDATCALHTNCAERRGDYCDRFHDGRNGHDLASMVFARVVTQNDVSNWSMPIRLENGLPGWGAVAVIRNADLQYPVRDFATTSCDHIRQTVFPSVQKAQPGDLLVGYMAFDDNEPRSAFQPPNGMSLVSDVHGTDEAGFLYQQPITSGGPTGSRTTNGVGGTGKCKDATISMVIRGV